jgi:hypothetical protein
MCNLFPKSIFKEKDFLLSEKCAVTRSNAYMPFDKKSTAEIIVTRQTLFLI